MRLHAGAAQHHRPDFLGPLFRQAPDVGGRNMTLERMCLHHAGVGATERIVYAVLDALAWRVGIKVGTGPYTRLFASARPRLCSRCNRDTCRRR